MRYRFLSYGFLLGLVFSSLFAQAQTPCFEVNAREGCVPFTIKAWKCPSVAGVSYNPDTAGDPLNYQPPPPNSDTFTHTYDTAGTYVIAQLTSNKRGDAKTITIYDTVQPQVSFQPCAGRQLVVEIPAQAYDELEIDFGDNTINTYNTQAGTTFTYTYASAGQVDLRIRGIYQPAGCGGSLQESLTILDSLQRPQVQAVQVVEDSLNITLSTRSGLQYEVWSKAPQASNYQQVKVFTGPSNDSAQVKIADFRQSDGYCYRLIVRSECGDTLNGDDFCLPSPLLVKPDTTGVELSWAPGSSSPLSQSIYRDGQQIASLGAPATSYADQTVVCNTNYCYSFKARLEVKGRTASLRFRSDTSCITYRFLRDLPPIQSGYVTRNEAGTGLEWSIDYPDPASKLLVYAQNGGLLDSLDPATNILDLDVSCLRFAYRDSCQNTSPLSQAFCSLNLRGSIDFNNERRLSWSGYRGSPVLNAYRLLVLDVEGNVLNSIELSSGTSSYEDRETYGRFGFLVYQVLGYSADSSVVIRSNKVQLKKRPRFVLPDAFSPNGDGANEVYQVLSTNIPKVEWWVYNRWGQEVFYAANPEAQWDGTINGKAAPADVYIIQMVAEDEQGNVYKEQSTITLMR